MGSQLLALITVTFWVVLVVIFLDRPRKRQVPLVSRAKILEGFIFL